MSRVVCALAILATIAVAAIGLVGCAGDPTQGYSSTSIFPEMLWPSAANLKFSRSPLQSFDNAPATAPMCCEKLAKPASTRRRASTRPSSCGMVMVIALLMTV